MGDNGTQMYLLPLSLYAVEKMRSNFTHSSVFKFETRQGIAQIKHDQKNEQTLIQNLTQR